jgi:CheY-like chemotaxis protein
MDHPIKVLIVDDDPAFVESIADLLEAFGYEVSRAFDGTEGVTRAREVRPDVMILDVMMSTETEGFETARAVREIPELQGMGVVLVTGVTATLKLPQGLAPDDTWLPVDRVLEKPISPDRLIKEIERVVEKKRGGRVV